MIAGALIGYIISSISSSSNLSKEYVWFFFAICFVLLNEMGRNLNQDSDYELAKNMRNCVDKIKKQIYGLRRKGFFSIFISSAASKVITFIGGMIIVRIMSKEDYGSYTYVINCLGVLTILNDFGCAQATMQLCSEYNKDKKKYEEYFIFGIRTGLGFVIITSIVVFLSPFFYPYNSEDMARLVQELCLFPLISTVNSFFSS